VPELPEIQAHAERLDADFRDRVLTGFTPFTFTALKTAVPPPSDAFGLPLRRVGRRGKYLLVEFDPVTFVVHLMQGGRLLAELPAGDAPPKARTKPRGAQARFEFDDAGLLLTEQGKERRAGIWCLPTDEVHTSPPLVKLGPDADQVTGEQLAELFARHSMRVHGFLRDQSMIAGVGRRLANEVCHRAQVSPFATTKSLGAAGAERVADALAACIAEGLAYERTRADMSASKDRPGAVHGRTGEPCPVCGDAVRAVTYSGYTVNYCPTCQTGGKVLADNTTSKFLR
jgi:formamidopyrimidine-DNA glycosylase